MCYKMFTSTISELDILNNSKLKTFHKVIQFRDEMTATDMVQITVDNGWAFDWYISFDLVPL